MLSYETRGGKKGEEEDEVAWHRLPDSHLTDLSHRRIFSPNSPSLPPFLPARSDRESALLTSRRGICLLTDAAERPPSSDLISYRRLFCLPRARSWLSVAWMAAALTGPD
ncbi:hypothetical protein FQA47_016217 [Oryzias melastigma]|uniref:Uncharacterized protein n=1 Tax=Oryzias melastigma TaxID=30732 RepID=A0A834CPM9_ORYME|nr:hypothetical protein FQA47_016217 [Oryzias melastigma]